MSQPQPRLVASLFGKRDHVRAALVGGELA